MGMLVVKGATSVIDGEPIEALPRLRIHDDEAAVVSEILVGTRIALKPQVAALVEQPRIVAVEQIASDWLGDRGRGSDQGNATTDQRERSEAAQEAAAVAGQRHRVVSPWVMMSASDPPGGLRDGSEQGGEAGEDDAAADDGDSRQQLAGDVEEAQGPT